jgi:ABC-type Mn2+/Zn2+ transport system permease subunit
VKDPSDQPSPIGVAFEWVGRILVVVVVMVVPGLVGQYLDDRFGTGFLALVGFGGGLCLGIYSLLIMTKPRPGK